MEDTPRVKLEESDWMIIPASSQAEVELLLTACTGIFGFQMQKDAPSLAVHTGSLIQKGAVLPVVTDRAMRLKSFRESTGSRNMISLSDILQTYRGRLANRNEPVIVYMASGLRIDYTDIALIRYFILQEPTYDLLGADFNNPCRAVLNPHKGVIHFFNPLKANSQPYLIYRIGKDYPLNLRLERPKG